MAGLKIWEALLDTGKVTTVSEGEKVDPETWTALKNGFQEFAYDTFLSLKPCMEKRNKEIHRKYLNVLDLRIGAAQHTGIENIPCSKLKLLAGEKVET